MTTKNTLEIGQTVRVHKNLHTGLWSIRSKIRNDKGRLQWKVLDSRERVTLTDCTPVVSVKGSERIRRNECREVVACIEGTLATDTTGAADLMIITYNPFRSDVFHTASGREFKSCAMARFAPSAPYFYALAPVLAEGGAV